VLSKLQTICSVWAWAALTENFGHFWTDHFVGSGLRRVILMEVMSDYAIVSSNMFAYSHTCKQRGKKKKAVNFLK